MSVIYHPLEQNLPFCVVALDSKLPKFFGDAWSLASLKVCTEKGVGSVHRHIIASKKLSLTCPDIITCSKKAPACHNKKVNIVIDEDESKTDIQRAVDAIKKTGFKDPILIFGDFDGKFYKTASAIHTALANPDLRICLCDDNNFSTWVFPETKKILTPQTCTTNVCGLLPILKPVELSTKGLKWDLNNTKLEMGVFISSSNEIAAPEVEINTKDPILWTVQAKKVLDICKKRRK